MGKVADFILGISPKKRADRDPETVKKLEPAVVGDAAAVPSQPDGTVKVAQLNAEESLLRSQIRWLSTVIIVLAGILLWEVFVSFFLPNERVPSLSHSPC